MIKNYFLRLSPFYVLFAISISLLQSCIKEKIDLTKTGNNSISPQYAAAMVYSSLTLADIMAQGNKNGQITTDSAGFITLVYKGNLLSLKATDIVSFPAQAPTSGSHALSPTEAAAISVAPVGTTIPISDSSLIDFQTGGAAQINTLNCKTATLGLNLSYGIEHSASIKVSIPAATLNGIPFTATIPVTVPVPYSGGPINISESYVLDGYTIDMTDKGTAHNKLNVYYAITITKSSNATNTGDAVSFTETFSNIAYNSIIGYLGQQFLSPNSDTVAISIFKNSILNAGASFKIAAPLIKVFITNSYGMPISASFNLLEGYTPGQANIAITGAPNPLVIPTPTTIGLVAKDSFQLNNQNSNITTLISNIPKNILYNISSESNPSGVSYNNFITDSSQFKVDLELDLPLYGSVKNFVFQDTVKYSFDLNTSNIESITVRAYFNNGFPIDVGMRVAFVDSMYNVIDELIPAGEVVIPSGVINGSGMVISSTAHTQDFVIPNSVIAQISKVRYILIGATVNTTNGGNTNVKIYSNYDLDVKLGINAKLFIKF
jgi:hypothetical protein